MPECVHQIVIGRELSPVHLLREFQVRGRKLREHDVGILGFGVQHAPVNLSRYFGSGQLQ